MARHDDDEEGPVAGPGLAIKVGKEGVEPSRPFGHTDLNRARLPFRHFPRSGCPTAERGERYHPVWAAREGDPLHSAGKSSTSPADRCACRCARYGYHLFSEHEEEPVSVLQRFEKRLEGLVEGAFAKVFKGVVHPVEILNAMQREAEAHKAILAGGRTLVPNRYVIDLSPYDHSRLAPYAAALAQELAQSQAEFIGEQGWTVYGDVIVEIERGDGLDTGMFRVTAEVYTGGDVAPVPAYDAPPPGYPPYDQNPYAPQSGPPAPGGPARSARLVSGDGRSYPLS